MKTILCIEDTYGRKSQVVDEPSHIPRIGETIEWDYYPTPKVISVKHDFIPSTHRITVKIS